MDDAEQPRGLRIIPAFAGSTSRRESPHAAIRDHPRIRGEHNGVQYSPAGYFGSSPHSRGAHSTDGILFVYGRIIPAFAGSTPRSTTRARTPRDHPRIRGEHLVRLAGYGAQPGSSPHSRGARSRDPSSLRAGRIIPAFAGSTTCSMILPISMTDHPRIRGEHHPGELGRSRGQGSSPHSRGAPRRGRPVPLPAGIIPAFAGSTTRSPVPTRSARDHPRIRGEHGAFNPLQMVQMGSSPHSRGALQ